MASPASAARNGGQLSREQSSAVRRHLSEILASKSFATCRRAQDFLRLIVEHALAGEFDSLRERQIGIEMFGRPPGYDTANDAVVRVKATEVRKKLNHFYLEADRPSPVRIQIPSGSYIPRFLMERSVEVALDQAAPVASALQPAPAPPPSPALRRQRLANPQQPQTIAANRSLRAGTRPWLSLRRISAAALAATAYEIALLYAGFGRKDKAFTWLALSLKAQSRALSHLLVDPSLDPLRSDPRFSDLLRQLSLG